MPAQAVQGATREGPPGTGGCGLSSETPPPCLHGDKQGIKNTQREYSTVPSSASLTSSFILLPSYCVGGSANRKVTVSEWGRGQKKRKERKTRESMVVVFFCSSY